MNDDETLAGLRTSLSGVKESLTDVHLDRTADEIRARARSRRLRRGLAGAGATGVALGVGLALAAAGGGPAASPRPVHVNLAAWSVNSLPGGLVYVDVRELVQPDLLRQTLARAGVPAIVTFGQFCTPAHFSYAAGNLDQVLGKTAAGGEPKLTINPAGIPAGSELSIGIVHIATPNGQKAGFDTAFGLVREGAQLTCHVPPFKQEPQGKGPGKTGPAGSPAPASPKAAG